VIVFAQTFPSLEAFYAADRRRLHSRERDVGLAWRGRGGATYRAAWVQATGEVYLFRHRAGTTDVLARRFGLDELHAALAGYPRLINRPRSLDWFLHRTAERSTLTAAA
jgi:hypothetical protein